MPTLTHSKLRLRDGRVVPYSIRFSHRGRRIRLSLNPRDGLTLVAPPGVSRVELTEQIQDWRDWVARQMKIMGIAVADLETQETKLPDQVSLQAVDEIWNISYRHAPNTSARVRETQHGKLLVIGNCGELEACCRALRRWLQRRATTMLPEWLGEVSTQTGLRFRGVNIRGQKGRWGSCSSEHEISLNYQLLFLPRHWVRHILIHELCHTRVLNHSPRFWTAVGRFDPRYQTTREEMRGAWTYVPRWASGPLR